MIVEMKDPAEETPEERAARLTAAGYNFDDPHVRQMADRHHRPGEMHVGFNTRVICDECKKDWPCEIRLALSEHSAAAIEAWEGRA